MSVQILESYLMSLGFTTDEPSFQRFNRIVQQASMEVERHTTGMLRTVVGVQSGILAAFTSLSGAVLGMADSVAMADQSYRLFGMQMMMTKDSARALKLITEGLGASLEQIIWDPELHARAVLMKKDIDALVSGLGPGADEKMKKIRDMRFELTRLDLATKFFGQNVALTLFEKFGFGADEAQKKLHGWVDEIEKSIPAMADTMASFLKPVLTETWHMLVEMGDATKQFATIFTNMVGLLTGDTSITGATFKMEKFGKAIGEVAHYAGMLFHALASIEKLLAHMLTGITLAFAQFAEGISKVVSGDVKNGLAEMFTASKNEAARDEILKGYMEFFYGDDKGGADYGKDKMSAMVDQNYAKNLAERTGKVSSTSMSTASRLDAMFDEEARKYQIPKSLLLAIGQQESRLDPDAPRGKVAQEIGMFQLKPSTAKELGVDAFTLQGNVEGASKLLGKLMKDFNGDLMKVIAAYNAGEGAVQKGHIPAVTMRDYVPNVLRYKEQFDAMRGAQGAAAVPAPARTVTFSINAPVTVNRPGASDAEIKRMLTPAWRDAINGALNNQAQMDSAQLSPLH